jgi:hypothetical protein
LSGVVKSVIALRTTFAWYYRLWFDEWLGAVGVGGWFFSSVSLATCFFRKSIWTSGALARGGELAIATKFSRITRFLRLEGTPVPFVLLLPHDKLLTWSGVEQDTESRRMTIAV